MSRVGKYKGVWPVLIETISKKWIVFVFSGDKALYKVPRDSGLVTW